MKSRLTAHLVVVAVLASAICSVRADGAESTGTPVLAGTWNAVLCVKGGKKYPVPGSQYTKYVLTFTESTVTVSGQKAGADRPKEMKGTYKLNTGVDPMTIDFVFGEKQEHRALGIFRLEGDKLIICGDSRTGSKQRPKVFESPESSSNDLIFYQRVRSPGD